MQKSQAFGHRIDLAEAIVWLAYGGRRKTAASVLKGFRRNRPGLFKSFPPEMRERFDRAFSQLLEWMIDGKVRAGGVPYKYENGAKVGSRYGEIPAGFLRSGVACEPADGLIITDHALVDERGNFVHHRTWGFARVSVDEKDLSTCLRKAHLETRNSTSPGSALASKAAKRNLSDAELKAWIEKRIAALADAPPPSQRQLAQDLIHDFKGYSGLRDRLRKAIQGTALHTTKSGRRTWRQLGEANWARK